MYMYGNRPAYRIGSAITALVALQRGCKHTTTARIILAVLSCLGAG
ncbi:hypothetical protein [Paenibacillus thiaminolyticus]|nr:hypothetical protein [Paenibacillus thiaminolyticus]